MLNKSIILIRLNKKQIEDMFGFCSINIAFNLDLGTNIVPMIKSVLRESLISDINGNALEDISTKLKAMIS